MALRLQPAAAALRVQCPADPPAVVCEGAIRWIVNKSADCILYSMNYDALQLSDG